MSPPAANTDDPHHRKLGVVLVDHGSRREESNQELLQLAQNWQAAGPYSIIEPAHMELAEPSIGQAFDRCVERGATRVVISPFFLLPGRHWLNDLPRLAAEAAARHRVEHLVVSPLGLHPLMMQILDDRIQQCLTHATDAGPGCRFCEGLDACQLRPPCEALDL